MAGPNWPYTLSALFSLALSGVIFVAGVKLRPAFIWTGGNKAVFFLENQRKWRYFVKRYKCIIMNQDPFTFNGTHFRVMFIT